MTAEQAIERYALRRMARGELLTWRYDHHPRHATLFVPDDVEVTTFPERIAGVPTSIQQLPRPQYY